MEIEYNWTKITLQNTKKGFRKLYELVMDLSNIQVIPYGEFIDYLAREGDPRDIEKSAVASS